MKKSKKKKQLSAERRKKQLNKFVKTLYEEKQEVINVPENTKSHEKKEVVRAKQSIVSESVFLKNDLRNLLILSGVLIVVVIAIYYYELQTGFLEPLADNLLKDIIK